MMIDPILKFFLGDLLTDEELKKASMARKDKNEAREATGMPETSWKSIYDTSKTGTV